MATPVTAAQTSDDDDKKLPLKKGRTIQPLDEESLKKHLENSKNAQQSNGDVLAELAARTAELVDQVKGPEDPKERILQLDEPENAEPKDIFAALEGPQKKSDEERPRWEATESPAVEMVRAKLKKLYGEREPDVVEEAAEALAISNKRSKHQQFMYELSISGKSLADIQTTWHNYYVSLPDAEKHEVWQESYKNQSSVSRYSSHVKKTATHTKPHPKVAVARQTLTPIQHDDSKDTTTIRAQIRDKVSAGGKLKPIHHVKSALFGIGLAGVVGLAITFVFFNEVFVAPFISPSRTVSATPIIGNLDSPVGDESKIIIPKINLEVPVVYDLGTVDEAAIQDGLEDGVVHYAASPEPGEIGNTVIVGHSSNNILNSGKYKFAFVLLRRMEVNDTFFVHKDGVRYTYKIYDKKVVPPTDTSVLGPASKPNSITLITCDPPGTSVNRLIIVAEQISPDPAKNTEAVIDIEPSEELPSNAPSLWSRLTGWL